jgi:hypothetical protein
VKWLQTYYKPLGLILFAIVALLPFLLLCAYIHPNAEDYSLSILPQQDGFFLSVFELYKGFDGRYSTNAMYAMNPLVFKSILGYKLLPVFLLILFFLGLWFFMHIFFKQQLSLPQKVIFALSFTALYVTNLLSIPHTLYWMASSIVFFMPVITFLYLSGTLMKLYETSCHPKKLIWVLLTTFLIFLLTGTNEMSLPLVLIPFLTLFSWAFYTKDAQRWTFAYLFGVALIAIFNFVIAPGIQSRLGGFEQVERDGGYIINIVGVRAIYHYAQSLFYATFRNPLILIMMALYLPIASRIDYSKAPLRIFRMNPFLFMVIIIIFGYLLTVPFYYPMGHQHGHLLPKRVFNMVLFFYLLGWLLNLPNVARFVKQRLHLDVDNLSPGVKKATGLILLLLAFVHLPFNPKVSMAYELLSSGKAARYSQQFEERYQDIEQQKQKETFRERVALIDTLRLKPGLLDKGPDIKPNRQTDFWNEAYEKYYNVFEVKFKSDTITKIEFLKKRNRRNY